MSGLLALLDDIAVIAKIAAASLDDAATQAAGATAKAAGIVIDDTAVTPRYVVGFAPDRELPIIRKIAWGSLKNKLVILLPGALALSLIASWAITPLLMIGGAYLCFEGYEKIVEMVKPQGEARSGGAGSPAAAAPAPSTAKTLEQQRVSGAIRTDLILSAEIMAIALASVAEAPFFVQAFSLAVVAFAVTGGVYGLVALIVKADDIGLVLARNANGFVRAIGRGLVTGMPAFLRILSTVGMLAMLWVGGGIVIHGLHELGFHAPQDAIHRVSAAISMPLGALQATVGWLVTATLSGIVGLAIGFLTERAYHAIKPHFPAAPKTAD